jgi:hypothetical protein
MESKRSDNYVWASSCLKHLIMSKDGIVNFFAIDRDIAQMNALNENFLNQSTFYVNPS